jgi:hypothetical protein
LAGTTALLWYAQPAFPDQKPESQLKFVASKIRPLVPPEYLATWKKV